MHEMVQVVMQAILHIPTLTYFVYPCKAYSVGTIYWVNYWLF